MSLVDGATPVRPLRALRLEELRERTSIKWRAFPDDVLPLWVAEMDAPLAEPVRAALQAALERGDTGYSAGTGYAEAYADFARDRWGWCFDADASMSLPDVMLGIVELLKVLTGPGDPVIVNSPVYPPFYDFIEHLDRRVVEAPLGADHRIDLVELEDAFRASRLRTGRAAYLLCSPHNPTGTVHTREELTAVIALAEEYGVRVVVDEIHAPLVHLGERFHPFLSLPGSGRALVLVSASKAWNLAGLKSAVAVAGPDAVCDLRRVPEEATHGASHLGAIAHTAALREGRGWLDALLVDLDENRRLLADLLAERLPEIGYRPPQGTYLAWLDCRRLELDADPAEVFLERGRVALNSGPTFGTGGFGHVRLNLATTPEILTEAVSRMATALQPR
ncbi:MalY/PatB family protein [Nocardioides mesophilus]|uniref:cysteine-S-conjugate beta-lyase n=1 Tax=Nocardioides mesophilus TaxID=433659 RepID=A0A7G9REI7_9ACTN|nr:aminotransferase class I/II-fold pyridoxal phosphate-dependent enzyme [Nocardioides mesophilus]QNN54012.1 aminotransferase class I/II-fold pyridoxal phosphate-dependent enzyme [Nocardioides mesophilus]